MHGTWRQRIEALKRDVTAIAIAARDPRTSWIARALIFVIVAYAVSPIDLIPDFIPVLGLLDDLVLLPFAIILAIRLIDADALRDARAVAADAAPGSSRWAAIVIVGIWIALAAWAGPILYRLATS